MTQSHRFDPHIGLFFIFKVKFLLFLCFGGCPVINVVIVICINYFFIFFTFLTLYIVF